jgi:hypothetical protein
MLQAQLNPAPKVRKVRLKCSATAEKVGIGAETVSRWLNAPAFPERRIRSDRRRDQALFLQSRKRGLQPSLIRTHYSAAPRFRAPQHAATDSVGGGEETFRRVPALLSRSSQTAPICSPVSSHAALAKCQETEYVDRFGHRFWIPVHGPVCENAAPRSGSSEAIDDNAMEQWPY